MIGKAELKRLADLVRQPFTCSLAAYDAREILGGEIMGYWSEDNPTAKLGESEGGHDFLIVEGVILDIWAMAYEGKPLVLDLEKDADQIRVLYGPREKWTKVR